MTDEPNKATMTVENVTFGSKSAAGRGTLKLTYSSTEYPELNQFLIDQVSNPIDLTFTRIQGKLGLGLVQKAAASNGATPATKDEPDAELVDMIVNDETAKVRRPRKSSNGNGAMPEITLHAFKDNEETPGLCGFCHHRVEDEAHNVSQPHAFRQPRGLNLDSATYEEDAKRCEVCGLEMWDTSNVHGAGVGGAVVEEVAEPSAVESLTDTLLAGLEDDAQPAAEAVAVGEGS